jgi:hypothetical protein
MHPVSLDKLFQLVSECADAMMFFLSRDVCRNLIHV